jgi:hypothetical protein
MKRKLIAWGVFLAILVGFVGLTTALSGEKERGYGLSDGKIGFTSQDSDITDFVLGGNGYVADQNSEYTLELTGAADIRITHKKTGKVWQGVPDSNSANPKHASSLVLRYHDGSSENTMFSADQSVAREQVRVYAIDNGVRVEYIFGDMQDSYIYPEVISKERMETVVFSQLDEEDINYLKRRYTLYELEYYEGENREWLLSQYPRLAHEDLYVLTSINTKLLKRRTDEIFNKAGYTEEDRIADNQGEETEEEKPKVFKVPIVYQLTQTGFKVSVDIDKCEFYNRYPMTDIIMLPYFDAFSPEETGWMLLPSGSGALMKVGGSAPDTTISLPVYGHDAVLTRRLDQSYTEVAPLPVFGQYKNGSGYLCVLGEGAGQATVIGERTGDYSSASASFMILDMAMFQLAARNDTALFASNMATDKIEAEYILLPEAQDDKAYSDMARIYRSRLLQDGTLASKADKQPQLLAEIISVINYNTLAAGFIPANKEYALTTFQQAGEILDELSSISEAENLHLLMTGWNSKGLGRQKLGKFNVSSIAGGRKSYEELARKAEETGATLYTDLVWNLIKPFSNDGYSPAESSARTLNNTIVKLSMRNHQTNSYSNSQWQLLSPLKFNLLCQDYIRANIPDGGYGVGRLTSMLYGDYANGETFARNDALATVRDILKSMSQSNRPILGSVGNLYTLSELKLINDLPMTSANYNALDYSIPFVQMVLHGSINYVSPPMNGVENPDEYLLKAVETGSGLHYFLTANDFDKLFETDYPELYDTKFELYKEIIKSQYTVLKEALNGLGDQGIIEHRYLTDDVVSVTYENGIRLIVNYGHTAYNGDGFTVEGRQFIRLKT